MNLTLLSQDDSIKNIEGFISFGIANSWENQKVSGNSIYGIESFDSSLKRSSQSYNIGARFLFKEKLGLGLLGYYQRRNRDQNLFNQELKELYPEEILIQRSDVNGISYVGYRLSLMYKFQTKKLNIFPTVSISKLSYNSENYEFVTRTPASNYYTQYDITNIITPESPEISVGFIISHQKTSWIELYSEISSSKNTNNYNIIIKNPGDSFSDKDVDEIYQYNHTRIYWKIGLRLTFNPKSLERFNL